MPGSVVRRRGVVVVAALVLMVAALGRRPLAGERSAAATPVEAVEGRGIWSKFVCVGCGASIFMAAGGTIGGFLIAATVYPEYFGACAYQCWSAFS